MIKEKRSCPECLHGQLIVKELSKGTNCSYCHKLIELKFFYVAGIPSVLAVLLTIFFRYGPEELGYLCTGLLVLFASGYESVFAAYLPLKHYLTQ
ncbi:MAG: hypothetical protein ACI9FB_000812 [Candidatus Azotimanducaceae bacterium]|jgi:hypothetical protein